MATTSTEATHISIELTGACKSQATSVLLVKQTTAIITVCERVHRYMEQPTI